MVLLHAVRAATGRFGLLTLVLPARPLVMGHIRWALQNLKAATRSVLPRSA